MEVQAALKEQTHGALAMLRQCIERCPDDLWLEGTYPRFYWRIVWHTLYFTHNHMVQTAEEFDGSRSEWPEPIRTAHVLGENQMAVDVEPYELPDGTPVVSRAEMLEYLEYVSALVDPTIDGLDLGADKSGFPWYPKISKMSHELMNLRHIQGHVGQLSELLMMRGIDLDWISGAPG